MALRGINSKNKSKCLCSMVRLWQVFQVCYDACQITNVLTKLNSDRDFGTFRFDSSWRLAELCFDFSIEFVWCEFICRCNLVTVWGERHYSAKVAHDDRRLISWAVLNRHELFASFLLLLHLADKILLHGKGCVH